MRVLMRMTVGLVTLALVVANVPAAFGFVGGDGSASAPFQVATGEHLDDVREHLDAHFIQTADINLDVAPWNANEGWEPIGTEDLPFIGVFDGDDHAIHGLFIDNSTGDRIGLFGATGADARIMDLSLVNVSVAASGHDCGLDVGGLVGRNQAEISHCQVTGSLTAEIDAIGSVRAGLMIGRNHGDIRDVYVEGSVSAINHDHNVLVGGLIGWNGDGSRTNLDGGDISNAHANVTVIGTSHGHNVYAGGLIGRKGGSSSGAAGDVVDSSAIGAVTADTSDGGYSARAGGLIGRVGSSDAGDDGLVSRSHATGQVLATASDGSARAGGLIGQNSGWSSINGQVYDSFATGDVTIIGGPHGSRAGGLIGVSFGSVYDSFATGNVTAGLRPDLGPDDNVAAMFAGGLIGQHRVPDNDVHREVRRCFATGNVTGIDDAGVFEPDRNCGLAVGGLIGRNGGGGTDGVTVADCYARGDVSALAPADFGERIAGGGLIGVSGGRRSNGGNVSNAYATGVVVSDGIAGALIAIADNYEDTSTTTIAHSFANEDVNPGFPLIGFLGAGTTVFDTSRLETTANMQQQSTFVDAGWDFVGETENGVEDIWLIDETGIQNNGYPFFNWQSWGEMSPSGGLIVADRLSPFTWPVVEGATWYRIWINRNGEPFVDQWLKGQPPINFPLHGMPGGEYRWWVQPWTPGIGRGPWEGPAEFSITTRAPGEITLVAPIGPQGIVPLGFAPALVNGEDPSTLTYRWTKDPDATWYQLWVGWNGQDRWYGQWHQLDGVGEASVPVAGHPGGTLYWWVRPWGPDGSGPWSGPAEFSTPGPDPAKPVLIAPMGGIGDNQPTFAWQAAARATWYRVWVQRGNTKVIDEWTQDTSLLSTIVLSEADYAWWVGSWNAETSQTVWSDRVDFTVGGAR